MFGERTTKSEREYFANGTCMELVFQVLSVQDLDEVLEFAKANLARQIADEAERTFISWQACWRREALEHYLSLSWSFVARENGKTAGFFLAQPLRFIGGHTQTLWVEHIEGRDEVVTDALLDLAIRSARSEHLQRVLISNGQNFREALAKWPHRETMSGSVMNGPSTRADNCAHSDTIIEIKTTKG